MNRFVADWTALDTDVNDEWWLDGKVLRQRSWSAYNNDPIARALVETVVAGALGPCGLEYQSLYQADDEDDTSDAEQAVRRQIDAYVGRAQANCRLDAAGHLQARDMRAALIVSRRIAGDGFAIRLWNPGRPDAATGTCWRLIDPARVSNPYQGANTPTLFEGVELDDAGNPIAIHVRSAHPNLQRMAPPGHKITWTRVPIFDEDGIRQVIHYKRCNRPDQIRGVSDFAPFLTDLRHLNELKNAYVIGKRLQAANCMVVEVDDPFAAARADRNGAVLNGTVGIKPGMKYYVKTGTKVTGFNASFQGSEFEEIIITLVQNVAAAWQLPVDMVMRRMTKTNLASSRAALLDYYQTCQREQDDLISQVEQPIVESLIREGVARGEIDINPQTPADWDRALAGTFRRPPRLFPDPLKEAQAAQALLDLGVSRSTVFSDLGYSFEDETRKRKQNDDLLKAQGVDLVSPQDRAAADAAQAQAQAASDAANSQDEGSSSDSQDSKSSAKSADMSAIVATIQITVPAPQVTFVEAPAAEVEFIRDENNRLKRTKRVKPDG